MKYICYLLLTLSVLFLIPNFLPFHLERLTEPEEKEHFDKFRKDLYFKIQSLDDLEKYANTIESDPTKLAYWNNMAYLLRNRFYHGFSAASLEENWIAAIAGYFYSPKIYFQYNVLPDDIMKYPMAGCSQQGIILQTLLKNKGINYKTVQFNHHYAVTAEIEGKWYFFDTNIEPKFVNGNRPSVDKLSDIQYVEKIYPQFTENEVIKTLGTPHLSENNPPLASNMTIFHKVSYFLSKTLWFFCFLGFILCFRFIKLRANEIDRYQTEGSLSY